MIPKAIKSRCPILGGKPDSTNTQEIIQLMKELCAEKRVAFLIVTHDNEITWTADRVLYLNNGELNNKT